MKFGIELSPRAAHAHLDADARRGRTFSAATGVLVLLLVDSVALVGLKPMPQMFAIVGTMIGIAGLLATVEGMSKGAIVSVVGGLVAPVLAVFDGLEPLVAVLFASIVLVAVEAATHASRFRSVAPPSPATARRRMIGTLEVLGIGTVASIGLLIGATIVSSLPIKAGMAIGVVGLGAAVALARVALGDTEKRKPDLPWYMTQTDDR
jgi:hypothetical protein